MTPQGIMGLWIGIGMAAGIVGGVWSGNLVLAIFVGVAGGLVLGAWLSGQSPMRRHARGAKQVPPRIQRR